MAPRIQIPVATVVDQAAGGDLALGVGLARTRAVGQAQASPRQRSAHDDIEQNRVRNPRRAGNQADAVADGVEVARFGARHRTESLTEGSYLILQKTGLELVEDVEQQQQGVYLISGEPETGDGELFLDRVPVSARLAVPNHRSAQPAAHIFEIALEGRLGDFERAQQRCLVGGIRPRRRRSILYTRSN